MEFRKIGNSDLEVSTICLGTWVFGGDCWGEANDDESIKVVREAVLEGINFIDTAPVYGSGRSEEVIGKALKGSRENVVIATKCGLEQNGTSIRHNLSRAFVREEIENSLRRLNVEKIDLYQCHWPDPNTPMEETFTELNKLVDEGKIRYIGVSNFNEELLGDALKFSPVVNNQMQYSLLDRTIEDELIPFCEEKDISILAYGPLGGGILTGKYKRPPQFSRGDVRSFFYKFYKEPFWSKSRAIVDVLEEIASKRKVPVAHVAINWVLSNKNVASCIVGCRKVDQVDQNLGASLWQLSEEELSLVSDAA